MENELKILFTADSSEVKSDSAAAAKSVKDFGDSAVKAGNQASQGFEKMGASIKGIPQAFDEIAAGKAAMDRISKSIDAMAEAAIKGGRNMQEFGRAPLQDLGKLKAELVTIKNTLNSGFKPALDRISLSPANFSNLAAGASQLNSATAKLGSTMRGAASPLTDFSRIIQDLPFGFIGIQNNLNPMLESFGRLKAETGSTSGALKAMAGSIGGIGGIGLALSIASSAIVILQNGIQGFNRKTKEASDKAKEFVDSMKSMEEISGEAGASVFGQIAVVKGLSQAILDTNKSYKERKNALEQLKSVNKSYFGDLTLEAASLRTLTGRVEEYTNALISEAIVKGFSDEIANTNKELVKQNRELDRTKTAFDQAKKAKKDFGATTYTDTRGNEVLKEGAGDIEANLKNTESAFIKQRNIVEQIAGQMATLNGDIQDAVNNSLKFKSTQGGDEGKQKKEIDLLQQQIDKYKALKDEAGLLYVEERKLAQLEAEKIKRDDRKLGTDSGTITRKVNAVLSPFTIPDNQVFNEIDKLITDRFKGKFLEVKIPTQVIAAPSVGQSPSNLLTNILPPNFNQGIIVAMQNAGKQAGDAYRKSLVASLNNELNDALANAVKGIGDVIGETLASVLSDEKVNPFKGIITIIAESIRQLGQALIAFGIAKKLATEAFKSANPMAIIAGGIGLIAAGTALKSLINKAPKFAEGGLVTGPTLGLVGEAGPELIIPLNRADQFLNNDDGGGSPDIIEFILRGNNLLAAIDRNKISRGRRGGPR